MASTEARLTAPIDLVSSVTAGANAISAATFAAVADYKNTAVMAIISANLAIVAGVRVTLAWTRDGTAQTIGIQLPNAAISPIFINLGAHGIEGDANTAITLTIPALGAAVSGEAVLLGFKRLA